MTVTPVYLVKEFYKNQIKDRQARWIMCACAREVSPYLKGFPSHESWIRDAEVAAWDGSTYMVRGHYNIENLIRTARSTAGSRIMNKEQIYALIICHIMTDNEHKTSLQYTSGQIVPIEHTPRLNMMLNPYPSGRAQFFVSLVPDMAEIIVDVAGLREPEDIWNPWCAHDLKQALIIGEAIYKDRTFEDMPVLADALEEGGCENPAILRHCRDARKHWRGCWVLDGLLTGRYGI